MIANVPIERHLICLHLIKAIITIRMAISVLRKISNTCILAKYADKNLWVSQTCERRASGRRTCIFNFNITTNSIKFCDFSLECRHQIFSYIQFNSTAQCNFFAGRFIPIKSQVFLKAVKVTIAACYARTDPIR